MAASGEPAYFQEVRSRGGIVVSETPKLDLESYISNYRGKTRVYRLHHIGRTSSYLYLDALKLAIAEAKKGKDVTLYAYIVETLHNITPDEPEAVLDQAWQAQTSQESKNESLRMDAELKGYKNNLIKESIRMGYGDLGRHCHEIGDLAGAIKAFGKMREYCQTTDHLAAMQFHLIHVNIDQESWLSVESNVSKYRTTKGGKSEKCEAKAFAALGLAHLGMKNYELAASSFLHCDPRMLQARPEDPSDEEAFNEVLTPNDIATYGALCSLASMDRAQLQTRVLDNASFRNFLELEPHLRRAISAFVSGKYAACLRILDSYKPDYFLDLYLSCHVQELFSRIRNKALVQYFVPFSCVTFEALASAFSTDEDTVLKAFVELIGSRSLDARIDLERRTIEAIKVDSRTAVHENALATAREYERIAHQRILRMEIIHAGLEVKAAKGQQQTSFDTLMGAEGGPRKLRGRDINYFMQP